MSANKGARLRTTLFWVFGGILIYLGIRCLYWAIKFGSWAVQLEGLPVDMRMGFFVSFSVSMAFFAFLFASGVFSISQGIMLDNISGQAAFRLTLPKLAMLIVLIGVSVLALSKYRATTKVTWQENRGVPLAFLTVTEVRGPCFAAAAFWKCRYIDNFHPVPLMANTIFMYYAVCLSGQVLKKLQGGQQSVHPAGGDLPANSRQA